MTEEQNQETHDDVQDKHEEGGIGQWFQDNLRIIVSIIIVALLAGGIYSYSKRTDAPQVAKTDTTETSVVIEEKEISDEDATQDSAEDVDTTNTVVIGTAPEVTEDTTGLDELVEDEKDEQGTVTEDAASTDNTDEAVEEAPTEETTKTSTDDAEEVTQEPTEDAQEEVTEDATEESTEMTEEEIQEKKDAAKEAGSALLAKIKAGAMSVKDKIEAEEQKLAEEQAASTEDETTDAVDEVTPTEEIPADTSIETSESFVETATTGDGVTHLARRALANSLEKNPDTTLTGAHKVYIEDYMQKNVGHSGPLYVGDTVEFSKTLINEAIASAHTLSDAQLQNLQPYASAAGY